MGARRQNPKSIDVERVEVPARVPTRDAVTVGSVNDPAEADADRLADQARSLADSYGGSHQASSGSVRRSATADVDGLSVDSSALAGARSGGAALDGDVRAKLEQGFGTDLGAVRVHTGSAAGDIARQISARAFTHGNDVYFGAGEYRPGTADGDHVLAHEVAHTVQHGNSDGVHRFPATWSTSPVPWKPMTASVFRPGEGVSGGVYILTSKPEHGPVKKAVVKPVSGVNAAGTTESGQQLQFSDVALAKMLGVSTPTSKVVQRGGSEFADLVDLCRSKMPPSEPGKPALPPLEKSESFVVMSEVPNATSVASLASKSTTDKAARGDLFRTIFDPTFLADLGQVCIGDLMIGNKDRMVYGAANFGNMMLSNQDGQNRLAAIDTTALLPKAVPPSAWKTEGGAVSGGRMGLKDHLDKGPGHVLDDFFTMLVWTMKDKTTDVNDPDPAWKMVETTYQNNRARYLANFEFGWSSAMITAVGLANSSEVDDLGEGYDDPQLSTTTLKANLQYIGARTTGASHDEAIGRSIALTAGDWAKSVDRQRFYPSLSDALSATTLASPSDEAVKAEVVAMPSLPAANAKLLPSGSGGALLTENQYAAFAQHEQGVRSARGEVDASVSATKMRRKSPLGAKKETPRNRSVVSHYIVHSTAMAAGSMRTVAAIQSANSVVEDSVAVLGADLCGNEAAPVKSLLNEVSGRLESLETQAIAYRRQLALARAIVPRTRHQSATALETRMSEADVAVERAVKRAGAVKKRDPKKMAAQITVKPGL